MSTLESKITYVLGRRIIKNFMDIIILNHLKSNHSMSGYDIIKFLHRKFHMLLSPGTIYSLLYSLERKNLIKGSMNRGKRVYNLTNQGEKILRDMRITKNNIHTILSSVFSEAQS